MGHTQIEESEFRRLTEAAGRVTTLESERDTAVNRAELAESERDTLKESIAVRDRRDRAVAIVAAEADTAEITLNDLEVKGLVVDLPVKEGALDEDAFTETVKKTLTRLAEKGRVRGFGGGGQPTDPSAVSESDFDAEFSPKGA